MLLDGEGSRPQLTRRDLVRGVCVFLIVQQSMSFRYPGGTPSDFSNVCPESKKAEFR